MRDFNINPIGVAWKEWCQKSVLPPLVGAVPPLLPLGLVNDQKMVRDPIISSLRDCQRFVNLSKSSLQKCVLCDCNFVLYVVPSSCTRLSNISRNIWTIFNLNFILSLITPENNPRTSSFITKLKCVCQMHCGVDTLQTLHISVKGD